MVSHPRTDDSSSESSGANRLPALTSPEALVAAGNPPDGGAPYVEAAENGLSVPLDFSTTSPSSSSEDQQMVNLSERLLPAGSSPPHSYPVDANRKYPVKDYSSKVRPPPPPPSSRLELLPSHPPFSACCFGASCSRRRTAQEATTL